MPREITPERRRVHHLTYVAKPGTREKLRCRERCGYAIKIGKLIRLPCEKCGAAKSEAHHADYSKPFDVKWLCRLCHVAEHRFDVVDRRIRTAPGPYRPRVPRTHCSKGHALTGDNVFIHGKRRCCRECERAYQRLKYWRRKQSDNHPTAA